MEIEKSILFKVEQQFPAIYRESGTELVQLIKDYYEFLETETNMSHYRSRRLFEYRDIARTTSEFIIQFHKMFMPDMDLLEPDVARLAVRSILDLYRRKGTPGAIKVFFRLFYREDAQIKYPGQFMAKPSDSSWRKGVYLEMYPNNNVFYDKDGNKYDYGDLYGKNIKGAASGARAAVDTVSFINVNKTLIPVLYLSDVKGTFEKYDDIVSVINGNSVSFGRLSGSLSNINITTDPNIFSGTTNHEVGEIFDVESQTGSGGRAIVTEVFTTATGLVSYKIADGGFGYTVANTELLVSDQVIIIDNPNKSFILEERLTDDLGASGRVIGQSEVAVGVKMNPGEAFNANSIVFATDRAGNPQIDSFLQANIALITDKNGSSPGPLFPLTGNSEDVKVNITNQETVSLITDKIADYTSVLINSSNYNDVPPAVRPMSGTADPVTLATPLDEAFDLQDFQIGTISELVNVNPGADYTNDVWAIAVDEIMRYFDRYEQVITVDNFAAGFTVGEEIEGTSTGRRGVITGINASDPKYIKVRPFSYYGFTKDDDIIFNGVRYNVVTVARDYNSEKLGESADIEATVDYESGKIKEVEIYRSGLGYPEGDVVYLVDEDGTKHARGIANSYTQGITEGYWATFNSHLNGFSDSNDDGYIDATTEYKDYGMKIQDSDYYQEYSYVIKTLVGEERFREPVERHLHLAGTKMFGDFLYQRDVPIGIGARNILGIKEDEEVGGDYIVGPDQYVPYAGGGLRADATTYKVDDTDIRADATAEP